MRYIRLSVLAILLALLCACSHKFDSNVLDLAFYQWNLWADPDASAENMDPSCGWDELQRGKGKLVRIPALAREHFSAVRDGEVYWYHCRFTLPENFEEREVTFRFEGVGPVTAVYLNQGLVGSHQGDTGEWEIDVSDVIYYTRDNHLAIRISVPDASLFQEAGIGKGVQARSKISP